MSVDKYADVPNVPTYMRGKENMFRFLNNSLQLPSNHAPQIGQIHFFWTLKLFLETLIWIPDDVLPVSFSRPRVSPRSNTAIHGFSRIRSREGTALKVYWEESTGWVESSPCSYSLKNNSSCRNNKQLLQQEEVQQEYMSLFFQMWWLRHSLILLVTIQNFYRLEMASDSLPIGKLIIINPIQIFSSEVIWDSCYELPSVLFKSR